MDRPRLRSLLRRRTERSAREEFWQRVLFGRWFIAIALSTVFAFTPTFGEDRVLIAFGMAAGSCLQSAALGRYLRVNGSLPKFSIISDNIFVGVACALVPVVYPWGLVVMAIMGPVTVIAHGRQFAQRVFAVSAPVFLLIGLVRQPDLWQIGFAIFTVAGFGSCALVGLATEEERRVRSRYEDILDQLQVVVFESPGIGQPLSYVNDHVAMMLGFTRTEWLQPSWWESRVHPDDHQIWVHSNDLTIAGESHLSNYRMFAEDGREVHILEITRVLSEDEGDARIRGVLVDVTRQRQAEAEASQLGLFVDQIPLALQILEIEDPDEVHVMRMVAANRMACDNVDATLDELTARWPREYAVIDNQPGNLEAFAEVRRTGNQLRDFERDWIDDAGAQRRVSIEAFALGGNYVGVSYEDITERANADAALRRQATHDGLTGLPNRVLLNERLAAAIESAGEDPFALLLMDLNQFKEVNDALGHHHGDLLLIELGQRLSGLATADQVVARLGGDEFAMLLPTTTLPEAHIVAAEIGRRFAEPIVIDGVTLQTNVSVGISSYPEHAVDAEGLLRSADSAMYHAKQNGTGVSVYAPEQSTASGRRLTLLNDLQSAIRNGELIVHYQPRVDVVEGHVEGLEALVRWNHPTLGQLPPDEFIGLAEVSGLIQELTRYVLRAATADAALLSRHGHDLPVSVNLSVRNLYSPDLLDNILQPLADFDVAASRLRVELTESELMDDPALAMQVLNRVRSHGIQVSIDDFGTGYSSLSYLRDLPIDEIKIDKTFVASITDGDDVVVRSIIDLGHALGVNVVGEGVETHEQWEHLRRLGCDIAQGYLISRPLPFGDLVRFLDDRRDWADDALATLGAPVTRG